MRISLTLLNLIIRLSLQPFFFSFVIHTESFIYKSVNAFIHSAYPEKPCNKFLFYINDNHYVNALNVIIYLLSCYPDHASEIKTISMLEVFHRIVRDWAVVWAQQGICIVPGIINNPEACCPLGKEMNCT